MMAANSRNQQQSNQLQQQLREKIIHHEDIVEYAYQDIHGYWTIGCGRLIDKRKGGKLSMDEMMYLLDNDIAECEKELAGIAWYEIQNPVRQGVLIELVFNMGLPRLKTFRKMINALSVQDFKTAGAELLDSKWAKVDVGQERSQNLYNRLVNGSY